jgi:SAM-dependent methyltransferase
MNPDPCPADLLPLLDHEHHLLASLVPLPPGTRLVEAGCGNARLLRQLMQEHVGLSCAALEVDRTQLARNLAEPALPGLSFIEAGAAAMPLADGWADGALMLKSLHHVPLDDLDRALDEVARVLRPGGWFYVSEPIYDGALNELVRLFNDEGVVRAAAQSALDRAIGRGRFAPVSDHRFAQAVAYPDFESFEQRMMRPSFADHRLTPTVINAVRQRFAPHCGPTGARFVRPMHVRLLRRP